MSKRIGLLTAVFVLAFPALASAKIVVNKSIAGVSLGESKAGVRHHLGKPRLDPKLPRDWFYIKRKLVITFKNNHVVEVYTQSRSERTASGIGVGSTEAAIKAHVKGVKCQPVHISGFNGRECITAARHGASDWTTGFRLSKDHVLDVLVAIFPIGGAVDRALANSHF